LTLSPPTGPYQVGVVNLHLIDRSRPERWDPPKPYRELMISVVYPARDTWRYPVAHQMTPGVAAGFDTLAGPGNYGVPPNTVDWSATLTHEHESAPAAAGHHRVVLYSPGVADVRSWDSTLVDQLASEGYVVVTIDPTYEASAVEFPGGRVIESNLLSWYQKAQQDGAVPEFLKALEDTRVADTEFVLDELGALAAGHNPDAEQRPLPAGLSDAVDARRVGMFGHSAGGFTALEAMYQDPRITAGIDMDGTLEYTQIPDGTHLSPVAQHGLNRPFLLLGSAGSDGSNHVTEPSWAALWRHSAGWHQDVTLPGTRHGSYTDAEALLPQLADKLPDGTVSNEIGCADPALTMTAERALISGFFQRWR
jgi:dienelactone hydrolase